MKMEQKSETELDKSVDLDCIHTNIDNELDLKEE